MFQNGTFIGFALPEEYGSQVPHQGGRAPVHGSFPRGIKEIYGMIESRFSMLTGLRLAELNLRVCEAAVVFQLRCESHQKDGQHVDFC